MLPLTCSEVVAKKINYLFWDAHHGSEQENPLKIGLSSKILYDTMLHERWKQLNKTWKRGSRKYWCFENAKFSNFSNQLTDDSNFRFLRFTSNWINIWEYKLCEQAKLNESIHSSNSSLPKRLFEILEETARASSNYTRQKNCFSTKCHIKILKFSKIAKKKMIIDPFWIAFMHDPYRGTEKWKDCKNIFHVN